MRYTHRAFGAADITPMVGLGNGGDVGAAQAQRTANFTAEQLQSFIGRSQASTGAVQRFAAADWAALSAGAASSSLCPCYVDQLAGVASRNNVAFPEEMRAQFLASCQQDIAAFRAGAEGQGIALNDAACDGSSAASSNTLYWVAGGAAALGVVYLLMRKK